ncbi:MAG: PP2C family protein-serine/threonine phosphatase [Limisphaerales bacterium]
MLSVVHAASSDRGLKHVANEDRWAADPELNLYVVSDGIGGQPAGSFAAKQVVESVPRMLRSRFPYPLDKFRVAAEVGVESLLTELSNRIRDGAAQDPTLKGLGATVVLAWLLEEQALIAHLGDSRAYRFRDGHLEQLTRDHTFVELLLNHGTITKKQAEEHPTRHLLIRSVGMEDAPQPESQLVSLQPGDRLLLCSDGLTDEVSDSRIEQLLGENPQPASAVKALTRDAIHNGGHDNVTALLAALEESD